MATVPEVVFTKLGVLVVLSTFSILVGVVTVTSSVRLFAPIKLLVVAVAPVLVTVALLL